MKIPNFVDDHYEYEMDGIKYKGYMISDDGKLPYFLVVPDNLEDASEIIVESLNRENDKDGNIISFDSRSTDSSMRTAQRILKSVQNAPIVIPIVPSIDGEGYYQQLSRDCLEGKNINERIDTQYIECIESAKGKIKEITGISVAEKVFLNGYSASGVFAQRFALIHPEIVSKCCVGGAVGSIPIPEENLPYPCGIKDFEELFGRKFDRENYKQINFAYYVGEHEASRPGEYGKDGKQAYMEVVNQNGRVDLKRNNPSVTVMPMHDMSYHPRSMSIDTGKLYREKFGETMQDRLDSAIKYYTQNGYSFKSKIFRDVAHNDVRYRTIGENNPNIKNNVAYFGIFSDHPSIVDVSIRVFQDISSFYENSTGFENDDKSVSKLDMKEQELREAYAQNHGKTKLEQLNKEQDNLVQILYSRKKEYEQMKPTEKERDSHEESE